MNLRAKEKKQLRRKMRQIKDSLTPLQKQVASQILIQKLQQHPEFQKANTILLYHPLPDEPDTTPLLKQWAKHKTLLLPVVVKDQLQIHPYTNQEQLKTGAYGILEPPKSHNNIPQPQLAIIPGVAFDRVGHRMGRGKGYYDKLLQSPLYNKVYKIGLAFHCQLLDLIPTEEHDILMNEVMTEEEIV